MLLQRSCGKHNRLLSGLRVSCCELFPLVMAPLVGSSPIRFSQRVASSFLSPSRHLGLLSFLFFLDMLPCALSAVFRPSLVLPSQTKTPVSLSSRHPLTLPPICRHRCRRRCRWLAPFSAAAAASAPAACVLGGPSELNGADSRGEVEGAEGLLAVVHHRRHAHEHERLRVA